MANIRTFSIPKELDDFLEQNPEISPSKIIQTKLYEIKNEESRLNERIKAYEIRNGRISLKLDKLLRWLEAQNIVIPDDVLE